jgi:hypothetical protein
MKLTSMDMEYLINVRWMKTMYDEGGIEKLREGGVYFCQNFNEATWYCLEVYFVLCFFPPSLFYTYGM